MAGRLAQYIHHKNCVQCGAAFVASTPLATTCSGKCKVNNWRARNPEKTAAIRERWRLTALSRPKVVKPKKDRKTVSCIDCGDTTTNRKRCVACQKKAACLSSKAYSDAKYQAIQANREHIKCLHCSVSFKPRNGGHTVCTDACSKRRSRLGRRSMERARLRGVTVERVDPIRVFERDGWRCHLCHKITDKKLRGLNKPASPELDHIVPLSKGGEHSYANTACSCRKCNIKKGATVIGQPSLLSVL